MYVNKTRIYLHLIRKNKTPIKDDATDNNASPSDSAENTEGTMNQSMQISTERNPIKDGYSYVPYAFQTEIKHPYKNEEHTSHNTMRDTDLEPVGAQCQSSTAHYENVSTANEYMSMNKARRLIDDQYMDMDKARRLKVSDEKIDSITTHLGKVSLMSDEDCKIPQSHPDDLDSYATSFECNVGKGDENDELDNVGGRVLREF